MAIGEVNPFQFNQSPYGTQYVPEDGKGRFEVFQGTFKQALDNAGVAGFPFSQAWYRGSYEFQRSDNQIKLIEQTGFSRKNSGALHFTMARGWSCLFTLETANSDFFDDELAEKGFTYDPSEGGEPTTDGVANSYPIVGVSPDDGFTGQANSHAIIGLMEGDYFSCDVEGDYGDTAQLRVRIDGLDYFDNTPPNDNVWVRMYFMRYWDSSYTWPEESVPIYDDDDDDDDYVPIQCEEGFIDNGFGVCVRINDDDVEDDGDDEDESPVNLDDVSGVAMIITGATVVYILKLALGAR